MMCNRHDDDVVALNDIDHVVAESAEAKLSDAWREAFARERMLSQEAHCANEVVFESIAQAFTLLVKISDRLIGVSFSGL